MNQSVFGTAANRSYYCNSIVAFCAASPVRILGEMALKNDFDLLQTQRTAWIEQTTILQTSLKDLHGTIYLEFTIPRMGARVDAIAIIGSVLFVLEFKVGERDFHRADRDQVIDYALDLHHFHEGSHHVHIAPILICTAAPAARCRIAELPAPSQLMEVSLSNNDLLRTTLQAIQDSVTAEAISIPAWNQSRYKPTPTIIEATLALYRGHSVADISRSDAEASNLSLTSATVDEIIRSSRTNSEKAICFVTGVPGAGKTLVGLNAATNHLNTSDDLYSVFLSGNGPLVAILQEALARDKVARSPIGEKKIRKGMALSEVKAFIQNVHHFRDECLIDESAPGEHVAIFDEAQRAWNLKQTVDFMRRKKNRPDFALSEPEFLISCLDRHKDWAVIICLVGGGQEINTGEAGIQEWLQALSRSYPHWKIYLPPRLHEREYGANTEIERLLAKHKVTHKSDLHLATSIRSFRSEHVSSLVRQVLDVEIKEAQVTLRKLKEKFPIVLTRDLCKAKTWLRHQARGSERYGIIVSSQAERLKPYALDVKTPVNPVNWFLNEKDDVRSSYYLEDVATEFHVQGLELDWACVVWDADFRSSANGWDHWSFRGNGWQRIRASDRQSFQKNAYRVLLTRARQGMVIVVPEGAADDATRPPEYYDPTFSYLSQLGIPTL